MSDDKSPGDKVPADKVPAEKAPAEKQDTAESGPPGAKWLPSVTTTLVAVALALVIGALLIVFSSRDVVETMPYIFSYPQDFFSEAGNAIWSSYAALVHGSVGSPGAIGTTLVRSAPLICAGLGVTLAFRAGLFNIGAQGQLLVGALAAGYVGFSWDLPPGIHLLVALVAGIAGGAFWGAIAGVLKARTGAHEVITTIMLNYLGGALLLYALSKDAFQRPNSNNTLSPRPNSSATFPEIGNFHLGVVVAFLAAVLVWWILDRSKLGFELRAVGANADASRTAGMNVASVYTAAMVIAGGLAGLAATMGVLGHQDSLSPTMAGTIGFDAITVALLGRATPLGTVLAGLLFGALSVGGVAMQASAASTPKELTEVLQALIVLFVAAPALVQGIARMKKVDDGSAVLAKGWGS